MARKWANRRWPAQHHRYGVSETVAQVTFFELTGALLGHIGSDLVAWFKNWLLVWNRGTLWVVHAAVDFVDQLPEWQAVIILLRHGDSLNFTPQTDRSRQERPSKRGFGVPTWMGHVHMHLGRHHSGHSGIGFRYAEQKGDRQIEPQPLLNRPYKK
jgi:hypothetical protein